MVDLRESYSVLELKPGAAEEAVRSAFKLMATVWHPDRFAEDSPVRRRAQERMLAINLAYAAIRAAGFPPKQSFEPVITRPPSASSHAQRPANAPRPAPPPAATRAPAGQAASASTGRQPIQPLTLRGAFFAILFVAGAFTFLLGLLMFVASVVGPAR